MLTLTVGIAATQMNFAQTEGLGFLMAQAVFAGLPIADRLPGLPEIHRARRRGGGRAMRRVILRARCRSLVLAACGQPGRAHGARHPALLRRLPSRLRHAAPTSRPRDGECGIITAMINQFEAGNPDIRVIVNTVFWPGYDQLTAQLAANGAPDLVTMHSSAIPDYEARGLLEPLDGDLAAVGISPDQFTAAARSRRHGRRQDHGAADRCVGAALAREHEPVPRGRTGRGRQADPAAESRRSSTPRPRSSGSAPASPISSR